MKLRTIIGGMLSLFTFVTTCVAEDVKRVEIDVESSFVPTHGVGILISAAGTVQRDCIEIKKSPLGPYVATFLVKANEIKNDSMATAMVFGLSDQVAFGNVRPVSPSMPGKSAFTLPLCDTKVLATPAIQGEIAALTTLGDYRETRRDVLKTKLAVILKGRFLEKLQSLEKGFGLQGDKPLSADLPSAVLVDRLSRILTSLQNYSDHRNRAAATESAEKGL